MNISRFSMIMMSLVVALLLPQAAHAIVLGQTSAPSGSWAGMTVDYIYATGAGTSVAISNWHLITANHYSLGVGNTFVAGTDTYEITNVSLPPIDSGKTYRPDMKIIEVKNNTNPGTALPGYHNLYTGSALTTATDLIQTGTGLTGTSFTTYYTEDTGSPRLLRWGTNRADNFNDVDHVTDYNYDYKAMYMGYRTNGSGTTEFETGVGDHDSGGGWFAKNGLDWELVGLNTLRTQQAPDEYNGTFALDLTTSDYQTWIYNIVPEPGSLALLSLGGIALLRRKRRK